MKIKKIAFMSIVITFVIGWLIYITDFQNTNSVDLGKTLSTELKNDEQFKSSEYLQRISELELKVAKSLTQQNKILEKLNQLSTKGKNSKSQSEKISLNVTNTNPDIEYLNSIEPPIDKILNQEQAYFNDLENNFEVEPLDDAWSTNQEQYIRTLLESDGLNNAMINNIDCRSKTCRADIAHTNRDNAEKFMANFMRSFSGTSGELHFETNANGGVDTIIYLTKNN